MFKFRGSIAFELISLAYFYKFSKFNCVNTKSFIRRMMPKFSVDEILDRSSFTKEIPLVAFSVPSALCS